MREFVCPMLVFGGFAVMLCEMVIDNLSRPLLVVIGFAIMGLPVLHEDGDPPGPSRIERCRKNIARLETELGLADERTAHDTSHGAIQNAV